MNLRLLLLAGLVSCASVFARAETPPIPIPGYGAQGDGIARHRANTVAGHDMASSVQVMADGGLLLGGTSRSGFNSDLNPPTPAFMRLLPNGQIDTAFGQGGRGAFVLDGPPIYDTIGMFSDQQGEILYGGFTTQFTAVVGKVTASGTPVAAFGQNGRRFIGPGLFGDTATMFIPRRFLKLQSGHMVVVGVAGTNASYCAAVARLTPQGNLDSAFGGTGAICVSPSRNGPAGAGANDAVELADGRLLIVGSALRAGGVAQDMFVARLTTTGQLDTSFGALGSGFAFMAFDAGGELNDVAQAVAVDANGRIVIAGQASIDLSGATEDMALARFTTEGLVDVTFGVDGRFLSSIALPGSRASSAQGLQTLADGRILASGQSRNSAIITVVMLREDGSIDTGFGENGQFLQVESDSNPPTRIYSGRPNAHMSGDHLYLFGGIYLDQPSPQSGAFAAAKYLMPLLRDGFDG